MSFIQYNPNPDGIRVGDCVIRALTKALGVDWETAYWLVCLQGNQMRNMPSSNAVWGALLKKYGFTRQVIPNECPDDYTVEDFCNDNPQGTFVIAIKDHVVCVRNGNLYDSWDSLSELPLYYWQKEE